MPETSDSDADAVRALYRDLLRAWNSRDADAFAALFTDDGSIIIYDGTLVAGRTEIGLRFGAIFATYATAVFAQRTIGVRFISDEVALLLGFVGMFTLSDPPINPTLNAIQSLMARRIAGDWRIAHFQNTRATFDVRPDLAAQMISELQGGHDEL